MVEGELIKIAADATIGALIKQAAEPALSAGRKVWGWVKGKVTGDHARTAAVIEAEPAKTSARHKVAGLLQDLLDADPGAAEELRRLLDSAGGLRAIQQTANFTGSGNVVTQVTGSGNTVTNSR